MDGKVTGVGRHPRIVLFGLFGIGNLGNESTLWVALHHLRRRLPGAEIACVCDALPAFAPTYGVSWLPLDPLRLRGSHRLPSRILQHAYLALATLVTEPIRLRRAIRLLAKADRFLVVGTGALDDLGELPWAMPAWILRWIRAARESGARTHLLAVGAGPIRSTVNRWLMTRAVEMVESRTYRDTYSRDYMSQLGVSSERDRVVPDLVFALPADMLPAFRQASTPPRIIGLGVMAYFGWNARADEGQRIYQNYLGKLARFVRELLAAGYAVRLLIGERRTDAQAVQDLVATIGPAEVAAVGTRLVAPQIESMADLLREIMLTDMVIASRFHNLIFALVAARPVVSIGYANKFDALMREMQLDGYCQDIENIDVARLLEQVCQLAMSHEQAVRTIVEKVAVYRQQLEELFDDTFGGVVPHGEITSAPGAAQRGTAEVP
jgi:polysaccharide pyruvyl transferase WcaK-like protein